MDGYVFVVMVFDYPREGKGKADGAMLIDGVYDNETQAQLVAAELGAEHDEAWVEPQPLNRRLQNVVLSIEDNTMTLHMTAEREN